MTALDETLHAADAAADRFLVGKHIPGVAYGVVLDGSLVHSRGIGTLRVGEDATPDADSVFRIASMTKSFTAATVVSLRDEGRLSLDDPAERYIPELADCIGFLAGEKKEKVEEGLRKMLVKPEIQTEVIADSDDPDAKLYRMEFKKEEAENGTEGTRKEEE